MERMRFDRSWVSMIMKFVLSVSYFVCLNGSVGTLFKSSRGFRQGDLLSLFFFLLCSEGLFSLLQLAFMRVLRSALRQAKEVFLSLIFYLRITM